MLPEEVSIITEEQRDWDDTYRVDAGRTYCFEFRFAPGEIMEIDVIHTRAQAQDLSLRCWFSEKPYGQQEFPFVDSMDVFYPSRQLRKILIGAPQTDAIYKMPASKTNYMMVQNAQNSENFFKLAFNIKA